MLFIGGGTCINFKSTVGRWRSVQLLKKCNVNKNKTKVMKWQRVT